MMRLGLQNGETFPEKQVVGGRVRIMRHCKEGTTRSYVEVKGWIVCTYLQGEGGTTS